MKQTTEKAIIRKEKHIDEEADDDEEIIYKIEIPANRFINCDFSSSRLRNCLSIRKLIRYFVYISNCRPDLLCLEGLAQSLRVFIEKQEIPTYTLADISKDKILQMNVKPEVCVFLS